MLGLVIIDMQRWMFRYPERAAQLPFLVANINALANAFIETRLPIFDIQTIHKADRSTWSRLMRKYNYSCLIEGTQDAELVDGYCIPEGANQITKTANSAFLGTNFEALLNAENITELVLTGVFADGCVGLTAADAAQRGLGVTFVNDAIGHTRSDHRATVLDWLIEDYELRMLSSEEVMACVRGRRL
jgi:nicotinamidase-related amidase